MCVCICIEQRLAADESIQDHSCQLKCHEKDKIHAHLGSTLNLFYQIFIIYQMSNYYNIASVAINDTLLKTVDLGKYTHNCLVLSRHLKRFILYSALRRCPAKREDKISTLHLNQKPKIPVKCLAACLSLHNQQ